MSYQPPPPPPPPPRGSLAGQKRPASRKNPGPNRSVNDFESEEQLRRALMAVEGPLDDEHAPIMLEIEQGQPVQKVCFLDIV